MIKKTVIMEQEISYPDLIKYNLELARILHEKLEEIKQREDELLKWQLDLKKEEYKALVRMNEAKRKQKLAIRLESLRKGQ